MFFYLEGQNDTFGVSYIQIKDFVSDYSAEICKEVFHSLICKQIYTH